MGLSTSQASVRDPHERVRSVFADEVSKVPDFVDLVHGACGLAPPHLFPRAALDEDDASGRMGARSVSYELVPTAVACNDTTRDRFKGDGLDRRHSGTAQERPPGRTLPWQT